MKIKFVGPKAIISHTGIEFDNNKEDKYVYLNIVIQLLKALDHEYIENKMYYYSADTSRLNDEEILQEIQKYCDNLKDIYSKVLKDEENYINEQIKNAQENSFLNTQEKEVLIKNINLMREYIIQRSFNKKLYYCILDKLADVMKRDHIDYVIAPMFQKFAHVFHSVEGVLHAKKHPIDTKIEIYEEKGKLLVKLDLLNH